MKLRYLLASLFAAVLLTGCLNSDANYTPGIYFATPSFISSAGDTLFFHYAFSGGLALDSINVGDTVALPVVFDGYANNLISTTVFSDTAALAIWTSYGADFRKILKPTSDSAALRFDFQDGYSAISMPLNIVARKEGSSKVTLSVETDSKFSPNSLYFMVPVRRDTCFVEE